MKKQILRATSAAAGILVLSTAVLPQVGAQTLETFHSLRCAEEGTIPTAGLIQASDGNFYGTTANGGEFGHLHGAGGDGTVFKLTPQGEMTTLVSFDDTNGSAHPSSKLVEARDGAFYGTTRGGFSGNGTLFRVTRDGVLTTLVSFTGALANSNSLPLAGLVQALDGHLYGTTAFGGPSARTNGPYGYGTIFRLTTNGQFTTLHSFDGANGVYPSAALIQAKDSRLYGTAAGGNTNFPASFHGTVFSITTNAEITTLAFFNGTNGSHPMSELIEGNDNSFYGTTQKGGASDNGTVFRVSAEGKLTSLVSFAQTNGAEPRAGLTKGRDGYLYGTTSKGGDYDSGTVFRVAPDGKLTSLASLDGTNAWLTFGGVLEATDGNLYGTGFGGGTYGCGTIFRLVMPTSLTLQVTADAILLSWPTSTVRFILQSTPALTSTEWIDSIEPIHVVLGRNTVSNKLYGSRRFYRLHRQ